MNKLGIVVSEFNSDVTELLLQSALKRCKEKNISENNIVLIKVPGAVEIPLIAQLLCKKQEISAVICLGAVIRGETSHYDYVCEQVSFGCQKVALEYNKPVIFGVLTTENEEQALARVSKGSEAVDAALQMMGILAAN